MTKPDPENELIKSVESGEWNPLSDAENLKSRLVRAASETSAKDFRMNIRLASADVEALKVLALREGIPYQTLVASVLHKFAKGRLVEADLK